ncbi:MAG: hypothetical protein R2832_16645 [Rhodothermales bacterium]
MPSSSPLPASVPDGKAKTERSAFSRQTTVQTRIYSDSSIIWALLTNATDFSRWNRTVISITGDIVPDGRIQLKSTLDEKRIFKLHVKEFVSEKRLVWGDSQGSRVFSLTSDADGSVMFSMSERIGSPLFPLFARFIPSFDESFEQFASDLKAEAETIHQTRS